MPNMWMTILWSLGAPAVDMFLVLSGYVVALAWMRQQSRGGNASGFYAGRMLRLMPIYLISFGVALICWSLMQAIGSPEGSSMKLAMSQPTISGVISNIGPFWPTEATLILNPPWWTLQVEFLAMFLIPPLVSVMLNKGIKIGLLWMIMVAVIQQTLAVTGIPGMGQYICLITVITGSMLAVARSTGDQFMGKVDRAMKNSRNRKLLFFIAISIMAGSQIMREAGFGYQLTRPMGAIAAAILIIVLTSRHKHVLKQKRSPSELKIGEMSYPLYAIHYPLMMLGASIITMRSSAPQNIIIGGIIGALVAYGLSVWLAIVIERRAVRRASKFMEGRLTPDELRPTV